MYSLCERVFYFHIFMFIPTPLLFIFMYAFVYFVYFFNVFLYIFVSVRSSVCFPSSA